MLTGNFRAARRATAFVTVILLLVAIYPLASAFGQRARFAVRRFWSRYTCWLLGIRVKVRGAVCNEYPTLLVPNHVSYFDVVALGAVTDATFIAKSEVDGWPLFGYIARRVGTLFIRRHWRQALIQRNQIAGRMKGGESFVLFAEGTSSNGLSTKPFKTSLLSVAEPWVLDRPVAAQGVTLSYLRLADGRPFTAETCDLYAWYDDMAFTPHLWEALKLPGVEIEIDFHPPVLSPAIASRKVLGPELRAMIHARLAQVRAREAAKPAMSLPEPVTPSCEELPEPVAQ